MTSCTYNNILNLEYIFLWHEDSLEIIKFILFETETFFSRFSIFLEKHRTKSKFQLTHNVTMYRLVDWKICGSWKNPQTFLFIIDWSYKYQHTYLHRAWLILLISFTKKKTKILNRKGLNCFLLSRKLNK